ncbi:MAG: nucleotidyltransferase domain-containing protein [Sulfolobales archaeon]
MRRKVDVRGDIVEVVYDKRRFEILEEKRGIAREILQELKKCGIEGYAYGSIARGDVSVDSDVDIAIMGEVSINILVSCLEKRWRIYRGEIIVATPMKTPAMYLYLDPQDMITITKYLGEPSKTEREFFAFGGIVGLEEILAGLRVPGVDKRLKLIIPTERGHIERPVIGYEAEVAKILGVSLDTVIERVRVLTRRDEHGRTGVYFKEGFSGDTPVEEVIRRICKRSGPIRRIFAEKALC